MNTISRATILFVVTAASAFMPLAATASAATGDPLVREESVVNNYVTAHGIEAIDFINTNLDADAASALAPWIGQGNDSHVIVNPDKMNSLRNTSDLASLTTVGKLAGEYIVKQSALEGGKTVDVSSLEVQTTAACIAGEIASSDIGARGLTLYMWDYDAMKAAVTSGLDEPAATKVETSFVLGLHGAGCK